MVGVASGRGDAWSGWLNSRGQGGSARASTAMFERGLQYQGTRGAQSGEVGS